MCCYGEVVVEYLRGPVFFENRVVKNDFQDYLRLLLWIRNILDFCQATILGIKIRISKPNFIEIR